MGLFDFFRKKASLDLSQLTGKDFEFLIAGDIAIPSDKYDEIMTPHSFQCIKDEREGGIYYKVGDDEFSYSWEEPGIQMVFNATMPYEKAKNIVDEVIRNINATGQSAELIFLEKAKVYRF